MLPQLKFFYLGLSFRGVGSGTSHSLHDIWRKSPSASRTGSKKEKGRRQGYQLRWCMLRAMVVPCSRHHVFFSKPAFHCEVVIWNSQKNFWDGASHPGLKAVPSLVQKSFPLNVVSLIWGVEEGSTHKYLNELWYKHFDVCFPRKKY